MRKIRLTFLLGFEVTGNTSSLVLLKHRAGKCRHSFPSPSHPCDQELDLLRPHSVPGTLVDTGTAQNTGFTLKAGWSSMVDRQEEPLEA